MPPSTLKDKVEALPDLRGNVLHYLNYTEGLIPRKPREEIYDALETVIMLDRDVENMARRSDSDHLDNQLKECVGDCTEVYETMGKKLMEIRNAELREVLVEKGVQAAKRAAARAEEGLLKDAEKLRSIARVIRTLRQDLDRTELARVMRSGTRRVTA